MALEAINPFSLFFSFYCDKDLVSLAVMLSKINFHLLEGNKGRQSKAKQLKTAHACMLGTKQLRWPVLSAYHTPPGHRLRTRRPCCLSSLTSLWGRCAQIHPSRLQVLGQGILHNTHQEAAGKKDIWLSMVKIFFLTPRTPAEGVHRVIKCVCPKKKHCAGHLLKNRLPGHVRS